MSAVAYRYNPAVAAVGPSPVASAQGWLAERQTPFPADKPLLDVAQAVPAYPPPQALRAYLAEQAAAPDSAFYTSIYGLPALRQALAAETGAVYHARIDPAQVAVVAGCNQGFCAAVTALAGPGDEIILPLPYYFNHAMWVEMLGASAVPIPFVETERGLPSVEAAAARIGRRTRAIALVSPNNPTGAVYPPALLEAFYRLAREHGLALILDETYRDFRAEDTPAHTLFSDPDWPRTLIQLYSFSKAYSLCGYRVGSVIAAPALLEQIGKFQDCVAICAPHIGQLAALYGLQHLAEWRADKRRLLAARAEALLNAFAAPGARLNYRVVASGAYFAYVKHPFDGKPAHAVARRLLDEQHILCLPGTTFGPGQQAYLRIAFANLAAEQMPSLVARLLASQQGLSAS